tara:strand:+ start:3206 stop:3502 length:297 start_codon:yes stop_codon:yes gene_type:complete
MNINDYIEKHSKLEHTKEKNVFTFHICVPLKKEGEKHWVINTPHVLEYLSSVKKIKSLSILQIGSTIINDHPDGLVSNWVFVDVSKKPTKNKKTNKEV